ncbi:uncharacterized protein PGTG_03181 [Puccinia graminis f. sp. tritici CRL 75-36-700-3]|uniref:Uncharacterized protein n=2 Tax=Puccinia graminis f. sp. tritici TaxID=56615 RepID=E3JYV0_PUCGT|nr:uncharacterized protein PGTG_03181 [Puccinia graminis f. sp. tritici CRL 75-36-700-3]EFP77225.2 hypothetical protein PGTG_03181 [Puccinia graminis f. sp. tritici CRL 75-36-700-3]
MTTSFHPPPPTPTRIDLTGMMEEAVEAENMEDKKLRHMSKDDQALAKLGYKSEFKREFGYFGTLSFAFSVVGLSSCVTSTFNTPFLSAGPAAVIWCWLIGSVMCMTIAASVAELVSAFPTSGGLYSASAFLVPKRFKAPVGFLVGWLSILGQIAAVASAEFALSQMIWSAYTISQDGNYSPTKLEIVGVFGILLLIHGLMNSVATRIMAKLTRTFIFFNFGGTFAIILALCLSGPPKQSFEYVFTKIVNRTGWDSTPLAFMMGILSSEWTLSDYDATAHISEEIKNPAVAAPLAIMTAISVSGVLGWFLNLVLVLYSPDIASLTTPSSSQSNDVGTGLFYFTWTLICINAFFQVNVVLQACSRTLFAFSRDGGLPDRQFFGKLSKRTKIPFRSVWVVILISLFFGSLDFVSTVAVNAVFSVCTIALDSSYAIPIAMKMIFKNHADVKFKPGPFSLGNGIIMWSINSISVLWVIFISTILALPMVQPVTVENMNYSSIITVTVIVLASTWYYLHAFKWYKGPKSNL